MSRVRAIRLGFFLFGLLILGQLFRVQVLENDFYVALAEGQHDLFRHLFPQRGKIYAKDRASGDKEYLLATNRSLHLLYAEPFRLKDPLAAARALAPLLGVEPAEIAEKLSDKEERYRVL